MAPASQQQCSALTADKLHQLKLFSAKARIDALDMIYEAQSGHPGTSFGCTDILTVLWAHVMNHDADNPDWPERDRFVMSKGHGAPALYATLMAQGYIDVAEKFTLRQVNSNLQGHPASKYVDGVDISTGSLGQGLSCAVGMALGLRLNNSPARVFCLMGDGECQEGNIWEAAMSAAHHQTGRLIAFVDRNKLQIDGDTEQVKALGDIGGKFAAFGWDVHTVDGHDMAAITQLIDSLPAEHRGTPQLIVANCTKGKGVSFMENQAGWHGKAPNAEQYKDASNQLNATLSALQEGN